MLLSLQTLTSNLWKGIQINPLDGADESTAAIVFQR